MCWIVHEQYGSAFTSGGISRGRCLKANGIRAILALCLVALTACGGGPPEHGHVVEGSHKPALRVTGTASGWAPGATGILTITLLNIGINPTSGPSEVTASFASAGGITLVSAAGTGWDCSKSTGAQLDCSWAQALLAGVSSASLTATVSVPGGTTGPIGLQLVASNASASPTTATQDLSVPLNYSVGGVVSGLTNSGLVLQSNGTDDLAITANGPFTFPTLLPSGQAYTVTVRTQPGPYVSEVCQVTNPSGTISNANVTSVAVNCVPSNGHFAYIGDEGVSNGQGHVAAYIISTGGMLIQMNGSPAGAFGSPSSLILAPPALAVLYAADAASNTIRSFAIDPMTGEAASINTAFPTATGTHPSSLCIAPKGNFLYASNLSSGSISEFSIAPGTDALTPVVGSPVDTLSSPTSTAIEPHGRFLYVTGSGVSAYAIDSTTGALTLVPGSPFGATSSNGVVTDSFGRYAYVINGGAATLSVFAIDGTTGALTEVPGSPYATGGGPSAIAIDSLDRYLYVANRSDNTVSAFKIDSSTGALTNIGAPLPAGTVPVAVAVDTADQFVYVVNRGSQDVSVYSFDPDTGALAQVTGSPFAYKLGAPIAIVIR